MKQCTCGSLTFWGHNVYHLDVKVDENRQWLADGEVYDSVEPYGPFTCHGCGKEYDKWEDIPDAPEGQVSEDPVPPEPRKFEAVFLEKPLDEGINAGDMAWMASNLNGSEFLPLEIQGNHAAAVGIISLKTAEHLCFEYGGLEATVTAILDDMQKENEDCVYDFYDPITGTIEFALARNHKVF